MVVHMIYKFLKILCLALGECQVIPALLYCTEIVNAALTTIHHSDILDDNKQPTVNPQQTGLNKAVNEVSEFLSTLNISAHHPELDKMIEELGKTFYIL